MPRRSEKGSLLLLLPLALLFTTGCPSRGGGVGGGGVLPTGGGSPPFTPQTQSPPYTPFSPTTSSTPATGTTSPTLGTPPPTTGVGSQVPDGTPGVDTTGTGSTASVQFATSLAQARQRAQQENKPIFLDLYATWCGPCQIFKNQVVPQAAVQAELQNFVPVMIDGEKGEGPQLVQQLGASSYPFMVILQPDGQTRKAVFSGDARDANQVVNFLRSNR